MLGWRKMRFQSESTKNWVRFHIVFRRCLALSPSLIEWCAVALALVCRCWSAPTRKYTYNMFDLTQGKYNATEQCLRERHMCSKERALCIARWTNRKPIRSAAIRMPDSWRPQMYPNELQYYAVTWYISRFAMHKTKTINQNLMHSAIKQRIQINIVVFDDHNAYATQRDEPVRLNHWNEIMIFVHAEKQTKRATRTQCESLAHRQYEHKTLSNGKTGAFFVPDFCNLACIGGILDGHETLYQRFREHTAHATDECTLYDRCHKNILTMISMKSLKKT